MSNTQEQQLAYYSIRAPFDGVVGDIPVHVGDYVATTTVLTTVDETRISKRISTYPPSAPPRCGRG